MASPVLLSQLVRLPVPPHELWRSLRDTDRMNREIGLPAVSFRPAVESFKARHYLAESRLMGLRLFYEEFPFEWVEGRFYSVRRRFLGGPLVEYTGGIRLRADEDGTELHSFASITPRNPIGFLLARTVGRAVVGSRIPAYAREAAAAPRGAHPPAAGFRALALHRRLASMTGPVGLMLALEELKRHLLSASETETGCLRPYELAERWGLEPEEVLSAMLAAAAARVLVLRWLLLCPSCRTPQASASALRLLSSHALCATCGVAVPRDPEATVEVRFALDADLRPSMLETFCLGGPANTPQRLLQLRLAPGERRTEALDLPPGRLRLFCYQSGEPVEVEAAPSGAAGRLSVTIGKFGLAVKPPRLAAGPVLLEVSNDLAREALLALDDDSWTRTTATAAAVLRSPSYRKHFP